MEWRDNTCAKDTNRNSWKVRMIGDKPSVIARKGAMKKENAEKKAIVDSKKSHKHQNRTVEERKVADDTTRSYMLWRRMMSVLIYARVTRKVRAIVRAKTNWHKVRTGVRKILQQTRDREQHRQCDICEEGETSTYTRGSKRLRDEVKNTYYKESRSYKPKKAKINEKNSKRKRKQSSLIVTEIGMELANWMKLCEEMVKRKKGIG